MNILSTSTGTIGTTATSKTTRGGQTARFGISVIQSGTSKPISSMLTARR